MPYKLYSLSIFFLLLLATLVNAASGPQITGYQSGNLSIDKTYQYRTTLLDQNLRLSTNQKSHMIDIGYTVELDYVFKWKLSILMGEPVVIGWVSYKPTKTYSLDLRFAGCERDVLNDDLLKKIRLTEFKMEAWMFLQPPGMRAQDRGAKLIIDAGSAAKPYLGYSSSDLVTSKKLFSQFASFNTPGSPDWNELFTNISDPQQAKKYFTDLTSSAKKRGQYSPSYYQYDVAKFDVDSDIVDQAIYAYLQNMEKKLRAKEKSDKKKLQEKNKQQIDEFDAALGEIENGLPKDSDLLSNKGNGAVDFDDILDGAEPAMESTQSNSFENILSNIDRLDKEKQKQSVVNKKLATAAVGTWIDSDTGSMWYYPTSDGFQSKDECYGRECEKICHNLKVDGHSDWRLPSADEVMTLFNPKRTTVPSHSQLAQAMDRYIDLYPKAPGTNVGNFNQNYQDGSIYKEPLGKRISESMEKHPNRYSSHYYHLPTSNKFKKTFKQRSLHYFYIYTDGSNCGIGIHTGTSGHILCVRKPN